MRQHKLSWSVSLLCLIILGVPINTDSAALGTAYHAAWRTWCLQAQSCAPQTACSSTKRGGDWDICLDDIDKNRCLVYSVGIAQDWRFDQTLGELGCEVHSFDPTVSLPEQLAPNVTFHPWGLSAGDIPQVAMQKNYGSFKGPLYTLPDIIKRLGHADRRISILKIDCEGCEWDAFKTLHVLKQAGHTPDQLLFEIHLSKEYGIHGEQELTKILTVYDYLFQPDSEGFSFSRYYWHDNIGFNGMRTISDTLLAVGVPPGTCCREMGFVRRNHSTVPLNDRRDYMQSHRHIRMHAATQHQP